MNYFLTILLALAFVFNAQAQAPSLPKVRDVERTENKVIYTCPMHPEVQKKSPDKCPKCGMNLVPKKVPASPPADPSGRASLQVESDDIAPSPKGEGVGGEAISFAGKTVRYDLYVTDTIVNFTGKRRHAYAINGQIPAPTLYFTEGDTAEIYLHNNLKKEETSLHWHGVILPNPQDGVPYLTTKRIGPGETHLYKFKVVQNGTYWYHSHSGLQEQAGMYGALVFKKKR